MNVKLDKDADEKAELVKERLEKVLSLVAVLDSEDGETFDFGKVISVLQD